MEVAVIQIIIGALGTIPQRLGKGTGRVRNQRTSGDYSIIKISQNTEKSPGGPMRLAVTQIPLKDNQLTLEWKTPNE